MGILKRGRTPVDLGVGSIYANTLYDLVGSHKGYHELGAMALLAGSIQHRWLPVPHAQHGKQRANLFGCILGRTSFDHKTTAGSKVAQFMPWDLMLNCAHLPAYFTEEGMYKELNDHPHGLIWRDEIGSLFASRQRKYTEFLLTFLTSAYDGWLAGKRLSSATYQAREIGVSILGATTFSEFARSTTDGDWDSGWLVRWLFAMPDDDYDPAKDLRHATPADEQALEEVRKHLVRLNGRNAGPMRIESDAEDALRTWRRGLIHTAMANAERNERVDAIIERYATYARKFAMLLCAGRSDGEVIQLQHAIDGCRLAENYMTNVHKLYEYQREHRLTGALLNKALAILNRHPEGLTKRDIGRLMNINATMRDQVIERMVNDGLVVEEAAGKTTRLVATQRKVAGFRNVS